MRINPAFSALALAAALVLPGRAMAGASDYTFELVTPQIAQSAEAPLSVRLLNTTTKQPVTGALIVRTRLDMGPDGMAEHATSIKPAPSHEPGVYAFTADLSMSGRWQLSLAAKVQGEPETVVGKLVITVAK